ncbi:MAG: hypothetical protein QXT64_02970, partial [Desulfurococcaceae archaeon]
MNMSIEYLYEINRGQTHVFAYLILEDLKKLNNPLTPVPEKISIARTWAGIICRLGLRSTCVEPDSVTSDESVIKSVVDEMIDFVAREIKGALRSLVKGL